MPRLRWTRLGERSMPLDSWLSERDRLASAATEGPWDRQHSRQTRQACIYTKGGAFVIAATVKNDPDAAFIADARSSLPRAVEMLRVAVEALNRIKTAPHTHQARVDALDALARIEAIAKGEKGK